MRDKVREKIKEHPRIAGPIIMAFGYFCLDVCLLKPLRLLDAGNAQVHFFMVGAVLGIVLILTGVTFLVFGKRFTHFMMMENSERPKKQRYGLIAFGGILAISLLIFLKLYLKSKGYDLE